MRKLNPEHIAAVAGRVNNCPYFRLLSMEIVSLEPGRSLLKATIQEKHLQPYGIVHGGVYASLIDAASFWAGYTEIDDPLALTTVEMKLNYLAPANSGIFMANGGGNQDRKDHLSERGPHLRPGGRLLAHGTTTMMVMESMKLEGHSEFPPKFLN